MTWAEFLKKMVMKTGRVVDVTGGELLDTYKGHIHSSNTTSEPEGKVILRYADTVLLVVEVSCLIHRHQQPVKSTFYTKC